MHRYLSDYIAGSREGDLGQYVAFTGRLVRALLRDIRVDEVQLLAGSHLVS